VDAIVDPRLQLADVARTVRPFNFAVVLGGQSAKAPYELLKAPRLGTLLEEARKSYDYVILDAPPLLPMPDCQMIGGFVDKLVVVVACDKTPRRLLGEALNVLAPDKVFGLVFNRNDQLLSDYRQEDYSQEVRRGRRLFKGAKTRSSAPADNG
jgi:Mrp family chromosome partitioning ATPase